MKNVICELFGISIVKTEWLDRSLSALNRIKTEKDLKEIAIEEVKWERNHKIQQVVKFELPKVKDYKEGDLPDKLVEIK